MLSTKFGYLPPLLTRRLSSTCEHWRSLSLRYFDAFIDEDKLYIVTEFAKYGDLSMRIKRQQQKSAYLDEETIWSIFAQICVGLKALHTQNILHRVPPPSSPN
jgi:serine/threonine protein kinase